MPDKYLPLGTVVLLKGANKRIMICGYYMKNGDKYYDYCGCLYPEGVLSSDGCLLFNHDNIDQVYYLGFNDIEFREFKNNLVAFIDSRG